MREPKDELLADFPEEASAQAMAGLLRSEHIAVRVEASTMVPGLSTFSVYVPPGEAARARALLSQSRFSDAELDDLATGETPEPE